MNQDTKHQIFPESDAGSDPTTQDNPGVVARPPLIYLSSILIGALLQFLWPLQIFPASLGLPLGGALILIAIGLFVLSIREFRAAGTAIPTDQPTTALVKTGPYRFSRNPIYLSTTLLHLGIAIWVNSAWLLGTLILTLLIIRYGVIAREERYLEQKFEDEYLRYRASVRRWL
jgi:protein-S-isoprenylcysteine O-methyltransferase Ste14